MNLESDDADALAWMFCFRLAFDSIWFGAQVLMNGVHFKYSKPQQRHTNTDRCIISTEMFNVNLNMIYAYDHLVPNKNKDDAHRVPCHAMPWERIEPFEAIANFQFGGDFKRIYFWWNRLYVGCSNIRSRRCVLLFPYRCCCWCCFFFSHLRLSARFTRSTKPIIERDAKRSHKNENENSIRQIKHKPKCPRELIILFYFVNRCFFRSIWRESEPKSYA